VGGLPPGPRPGTIPTYIIDAGVGVDLPELSYAVTTNGLDWTLAWTGDDFVRGFSGEIIGPGRLSQARFSGGFAGDEVTQPEAGRLRFSAATDISVMQSITVRSDQQPVRFNLFIDGAPAVRGVVFSSGGVVSANEAIPFDLMTADRAQGVETAHPPAAARDDGARTSAAAGKARERFVPAP
jgi:hypothetical protein